MNLTLQHFLKPEEFQDFLDLKLSTLNDFYKTNEKAKAEAVGKLRQMKKQNPNSLLPIINKGNYVFARVQGKLVGYLRFDLTPQKNFRVLEIAVSPYYQVRAGVKQPPAIFLMRYARHLSEKYNAKTFGYGITRRKPEVLGKKIKRK